MEEKQYNMKVYEVDSEELKGRKWKPGFKHFPYLSFVALMMVLGLCGGIITVIVTSDGKQVDEWNSHSANLLNHQKDFSISVNVWISGFVFFAGKLVALIFAEAVTTAWWVRAINGRELRQLAHDFDSSRSITSIFKSPRLFSWICLGSIAFTGFSGLGMILQKATGSVVVDKPQHGVDLTTNYATRMPFGWSGQQDGLDPSVRPVYSHEMSRIIHEYQQRLPIKLDVQGCATNNATTCSTSFLGLGFQFNCYASTGVLPKPVSSKDHANKTVWAVGVDWNQVDFEPPYSEPHGSLPFKKSEDPNRIDIRAFWKNDTGCTGRKLVVQNCVLTPALVHYPIKVTNNVTLLLPATSTAHWLTPHDGMLDLPTDKFSMSLHNASAESENRKSLNTPTTWGGVARLFSQLWASNIRYWEKGAGFYAHIESSNLFASIYQTKSKWVNPGLPEYDYPTGACYNKFDNPLVDIANSIREIMFRISVEASKGNINGIFFDDSSNGRTSTGPPPIEHYTNSTSTVHQALNIYKSHYLYLWLGIGLMLLALLIIFPLFWDFWLLGRKVSLSPLELATALHTSSAHGDDSKASVFETTRQKLAGNSLSNADTKELIREMGDIKVKYGQVGPRTLGLAVEEVVAPPNSGAFYS